MLGRVDTGTRYNDDVEHDLRQAAYQVETVFVFPSTPHPKKTVSTDIIKKCQYILQ